MVNDVVVDAQVRATAPCSDAMPVIVGALLKSVGLGFGLADAISMATERYYDAPGEWWHAVENKRGCRYNAALNAYKRYSVDEILVFMNTYFGLEFLYQSFERECFALGTNSRPQGLYLNC